MEANGNICVATIGDCGISVVSPAGELVEFVATDELFTTHIAFGGPDRQDAYITMSGNTRQGQTGGARTALARESLSRPYAPATSYHTTDPPPRRPRQDTPHQ